MNKGFDRDRFIECLENEFGINSFTIDMIDRIISYGHRYYQVSKDQFCYFIVDMMPNYVDFEFVAQFCGDEILSSCVRILPHLCGR